jgi:hypothetical protein
MPLYYFMCTTCQLRGRKILKAGEQKLVWPCPTCNNPLVRDPKPPSSQMKESLDNGVMTRRVERLQNAEELYRERAKNDPRFKRV